MIVGSRNKTSAKNMMRQRLLVLATFGVGVSAFGSGTRAGMRRPRAAATPASSTALSSKFDFGDFGPPTLKSTNEGNPQTKKKQLKSLQRFLEVECWKRTDLRSLDRVLLGVGDACKQIHRLVRRAQTDDLYGPAAPDVGANGEVETNIQGEVPQLLDVLCNTLMLRAFCGAGSNVLRGVASEEEDHARDCANVMMQAGEGTFVTMGDFENPCSQEFQGGEFVAAFDPIDGSKNIDASLPVGTVFGIYRCPAGGGNDDTCGVDEEVDKCFKQPGTSLVAAGYCLYSATTVLVLTLGSGVHGFTLDPDKQMFLQTHPDMRIPDRGDLYSFNEANFREFDEPVQKFLDKIKMGQGVGTNGGKPCARYVGALVADVHNVLINGGIYGYPATKSHKEGKLRYLYESAPMAMIMEQAGGAGSTGRGRILDVVPDEIHLRVPTFLGSVENVFELDQFHEYYGDDDKKE